MINHITMKKLLLLVSLFAFTYVKAQDEADDNYRRGGFKKENLFTGGGLQLLFDNGIFVGGVSPVFGYSINKWVDAGIVANFTYASNNHVIYEDQNGNYLYTDDRLKRIVYGPGAFVKVYPLKFLFVHAQGEMNFISQKLDPVIGPVERKKYNVPSLLVGVGYAGGRQGVGNFFYHISLSFDVLRRPNSPYVETLASGRVNALPIIRAGIQVPLFSGKNLFN